MKTRQSKKDGGKKKKWEAEIDEEEQNIPDKIDLPENYGHDSEDDEYEKHKKQEEERQQKLLLKEIEDKAKEDIAKHNSMQALIEKENNDEDEKLDPEDPELRSVFIAGVPKKYNEIEIEEMCKGFGKIKSIDLIRIEGADRNKGKALIEFYNTVSANKAKQSLDGKTVEGKILRVNIGIRSSCTLVEKEDSDSSGDERRNRNEKKIQGLSDSSEEEVITKSRKRKRDFEKDEEEEDYQEVDDEN